MRFPFFRNRDSVKNGILISIRRTGDGFHPGLFNYLKKKCRIECIETSYADGLIVPGQNTEDLLREIELLSGKIFNGITEIRILLEQIEDAQLFHAIITLTEEQKKVILLRIFYEKTFREIGRILEMSEKKAENTYYNALKKMRKLLRGDKYGI